MYTECKHTVKERRRMQEEWSRKWRHDWTTKYQNLPCAIERADNGAEPGRWHQYGFVFWNACTRSISRICFSKLHKCRNDLLARYVPARKHIFIEMCVRFSNLHAHFFCISRSCFVNCTCILWNGCTIYRCGCMCNLLNHTCVAIMMCVQVTETCAIYKMPCAVYKTVVQNGKWAFHKRRNISMSPPGLHTMEWWLRRKRLQTSCCVFFGSNLPSNLWAFVHWNAFICICMYSYRLCLSFSAREREHEAKRRAIL